MLFGIWCNILTLCVTAIASPFTNHATRQADTQPSSPVETIASLTPNIIYEYPKGTWLENFVIRQQDGNAVVTLLSTPEVYLVSITNDFQPILLARFDGNLGCSGIVEMGHEIFYVVVGNYSIFTGQSSPGSYSIWEINLTNFSLDDQQSITTREAAVLPGSGILNGMEILNPFTGTVLVAESLYGLVWSVNVRTGAVHIAVNDNATMSIDPKAAGGLTIGINGITNRDDGYLYYDNTDRATFNRIPIDVVTGSQTGPAETLVSSNTSVFFPDDLTIGFAGNAFVASDKLGQIVLLRDVTSGGHPSVEVIAGNKTDTSITGFTAAKFGTSEEDLRRGSLYVTTNGGPVNYFFSNWTSGGMLIRYDTAELGLW